MTDPLLVAREISVRLGGRTILDNVSVTLRAGTNSWRWSARTVPARPR